MAAPRPTPPPWLTAAERALGFGALGAGLGMLGLTVWWPGASVAVGVGGAWLGAMAARMPRSGGPWALSLVVLQLGALADAALLGDALLAVVFAGMAALGAGLLWAAARSRNRGPLSS